MQRHRRTSDADFANSVRPLVGVEHALPRQATRQLATSPSRSRSNSLAQLSTGSRRADFSAVPLTIWSSSCPTVDVWDSAGTQKVLAANRKRGPWLKHLFADADYDRTKLMDKAAILDFAVEIVRRLDKAAGFEVIPRRWVEERTFGWMIRWRRLVRDYEKRLDVSEAMIHVAMGALLLRRVAHR
jgi:transposase